MEWLWLIPGWFLSGMISTATFNLTCDNRLELEGLFVMRDSSGEDVIPTFLLGPITGIVMIVGTVCLTASHIFKTLGAKNLTLIDLNKMKQKKAEKLKERAEVDAQQTNLNPLTDT